MIPTYQMIQFLTILENEDIMDLEKLHNNEELNNNQELSREKLSECKYVKILSVLNYIADERSIDDVLEKLCLKNLNMLYEGEEALTSLPKRKIDEFIENMRKFVQVSCGCDFLSALRKNGTIVTWKNDEYYQISEFPKTEILFKYHVEL